MVLHKKSAILCSFFLFLTSFTQTQNGFNLDPTMTIPPAILNGLMQYEQAKWKMVGENLPQMLPAFFEGSHEAMRHFNGAFRNGFKDFNGTMQEGMQGLADTWAPGGSGDQAIGNFSRSYGDHTGNAMDTILTGVSRGSGKIGLVIGGVIIGVGLIYFTIKHAIPYWFEKLRQPTLIIESSKKSFKQRIKNRFTRKQEPRKKMIFNPELDARLTGISKATKAIRKKIKAKKKKVYYRNLMLYGPPGTGKTMFAKELARQSGLDYAIMSGSSFAKFKDGDGINELDKLFKWANKSKKGLILFIDEAETLLSHRDGMEPNSKPYLLLNNFLNHTGERSRKFMIIFATNHKDGLDSAMYRRIDDLIEVTLPGLNERIQILQSYIQQLLCDTKQNSAEFIASAKKHLTEEKIKEIAHKTVGLSGGDLEGIINIIQTDVDQQNGGLITLEVIDAAVDRAVKKLKDFTDKETILSRPYAKDSNRKVSGHLQMA